MAVFHEVDQVDTTGMLTGIAENLPKSKVCKVSGSALSTSVF